MVQRRSPGDHHQPDKALNVDVATKRLHTLQHRRSLQSAEVVFWFLSSSQNKTFEEVLSGFGETLGPFFSKLLIKCENN